MILALLLLLAPEDVDELGALEAAVANALRSVEPSVVTIETAGGVRLAELPPEAKDKMTLPERPRDEKDAPKEGEPEEEGAVAHVDVDDVKAEAERLRAEGVNVGVVLELHGEMRLLDVFDPDGNRIQLAQDVSGEPAA